MKLVLPNRLATPALLHHGGYIWTLKARTAGRLVVVWRHGHTVIARGQTRFIKPGRTKVRLRLTAIGRRLLRTHRSLRLTTQATYTTNGGTRITRRQILRLVK